MNRTKIRDLPPCGDDSRRSTISIQRRGVTLRTSDSARRAPGDRPASATRPALAEHPRGELEARYRLLVEQIDAITYITEFGEDGEARTSYMSPQVEEILGYRAEEWLADPTLRDRVLHPADASRVRMQERRCQRDGVAFEAEYRAIAKGGHAVWIHDRMTPVSDPSGKVRVAQGVMIDITLQKRAELGIRRREEILEAVAFSADRLLRSPSWESELEPVLERLGRATMADRAGFLRTRVASGGEVLLSFPWSWAKPGLPPLDELLPVPELPAREMGLERLIDRLREGQIVTQNVEDLDPDETPLFDQVGVGSNATIPIFVGDEWFGAIGFTSERRRGWSEAELDALRAAAGAIGSAIARQRWQTALAESEERFRRLAENAPDIIYRYRLLPEPGYEFVNSAVTRLTGYAPEELYADPDFGLRIVHPDDRDRLSRDRWPAFEEPVRMRWIRKDGTSLWTEQRQVPIRDADGRLVAVEGVDRDVTEQVEAEIALKERMKELTCLFGITRDTQHGYSPQELCERAARQLVPAMQHPELTVARIRVNGASADSHPGAALASEITAEVHAHGSSRGLITVGYTEDREFLPEEQLLIDSVAKTLGMWHGRHEALAELRESEERFRLLAENAQDFMFRYRLHPTPGFEYVSPSLEAMSGYGPDELYANPLAWEETIHPDDRDEFLRMTASSWELLSPFTLRWITKDGRTVWFETKATGIVDEQGHLVALEGITRDVTEQRFAEQQLRETITLLRRTDRERRKLISQLASAQEEERKRIAADIHDDSIQVMTAAGMRLGILRRRLDDERQLEALDEVESTVQRAIRRLRRLMFELQPPALDRAGLAAAIRALLEARRSDEEDGPDYEVQDRLEREPPAETRALMYRIVQEALTNAMKHAHASTVSVELEELDGRFVARVSDDGAGFDLEEVETFHPGHVGLPSMRERADLLGGECEISSAPGRGTTVTVRIPVATTEDGGDAP